MLSVRIPRKFSPELGFLQVLQLIPLLALLFFALTVAAQNTDPSTVSPFVTDSVSSAIASSSSSDLQSNAPPTLAETTTTRPATPPSPPSPSPSVNQPARGRPPVSGADSAPGQVSYHYKTINGLNIFYRQAGLPTSPTLLLLHGFPTSSHQYRELIPLLSRDFFIIAPDYPGFGNSDSPLVTQFNYTFDNLAASVTQLIVELGLPARGGITFYVQDYGAAVGFRIITAHPEWVENIVIQNGNIYPNGLGSGFGPVFNYWAAPSPATEAPLRALTTAPLVKFQFVNGVSNPDLISPDAYLNPLISLARPGNDLVQLKLLFDYQYNLPLYPSWVQYMRVYRPRTLVVWGLNDIFFVFPSSLPADNPNARLVSYNTGHFALEEARYDIATRIRRFAARDRDD